ncbi:MAG TPA: Smr/MutS family protein [Novosphingobium sp.]|nr:Smr/MutS family protein [Novosphingobium sp.]
MSKPPRGLTPEEAELWAKVAATVKPLQTLPQGGEAEHSLADGGAPATIATPAPKVRGRVPPPLPPAPPRQPAPRALDRHGLDSRWDRKLAKAAIAPDFTLDLHGHTLDSAHARLDHGLTQAVSMGARLVLLITGRPRPSDDYASRGERRGAIRAKVLDWLAAGPHASRIAAVRPAHPKHGGAGAVYIVLRRER